MTGFGRGEVREDSFVISAELRSLNHRFLDIDLRLPKDFSVYEYDIRQLISTRLTRGRVSLTLTVKGDYTPAARLNLDKPLASRYLGLVKELREEFGLSGAVDVQQLLTLPDIISFEASDNHDGNVGAAVIKCVNLSLDELHEMRLREGKELEKDLFTRLQQTGELIVHIQESTKQNAKAYYAKLKERISALLESNVLDDERLETEVAMLAEKADVTEECIRFQSHNKLFAELLANGSSEGRRLNFLLQEMNREANTIGAKANDAQIAHWVVNIKEEVEKLREQVQNIE